MRTIFSLLSVLVVGSMVLAADSTSTAKPVSQPAVAPAAVPAPAPAAAPVAAPAPAPVAPVAEPAAPEKPAPSAAPVPMEKPAPAACAAKPACAPGQMLTWSGLAMLRLRDDIITNFPNTGANAGKETESAAFSYQIAYKLGVKAKPNDQTTLQFEIGNDWYATEEAEGIPGNYWTKRNPMTPWFDLAYAQWDPGYLHFQAGIIPVRGTPLMDLLGVSLFFNRTYHNAAHIPWGVVTNFCQTGLRLGAPIVTGPVSVGVDAMSAIIEQRPVYVAGVDSMKLNASAVEFELEAPVSVSGLTVTPQTFITPFRSFNKATGKSDIEFGAGFDVGYKATDAMLLRAGFGYARNSNRNTYSPSNTILDFFTDPITGKSDTINKSVDSTEFDRWGTNLNVGTTIKLGPGKLDFDFNLSNEQNAYNKDVDDWYPFFDLKYGLALTKNFIVMPRIRLFFTEPKVNYNNELKSRPELIFTGTF
jgi:hypothetical protein